MLKIISCILLSAVARASMLQGPVGCPGEPLKLDIQETVKRIELVSEIFSFGDEGARQLFSNALFRILTRNTGQDMASWILNNLKNNKSINKLYFFSNLEKFKAKADEEELYSLNSLHQTLIKTYNEGTPDEKTSVFILVSPKSISDNIYVRFGDWQIKRSKSLADENIFRMFAVLRAMDFAGCGGRVFFSSKEIIDLVSLSCENVWKDSLHRWTSDMEFFATTLWLNPYLYESSGWMRYANIVFDSLTNHTKKNRAKTNAEISEIPFFKACISYDKMSEFMNNPMTEFLKKHAEKNAK